MEARAAELNQLVERGRKLRDAGRWTEAIACYSAANEIDGSRYDIKHNLALSFMAANRTQEANLYVAHAIALKPDLWPSHILKARMLKEKGQIEAADDVLMHVLKYDPQNGHALLAAADLDMNEFGDAVGARERVAPLLHDPTFKAEAELTTLMSKLYDRDEGDEELSYMLMDFAKRELNIPGFTYSAKALQGVTNRSCRPRIGLLSPMFCASPVYFLTISTFRELANEYDLIVLNRGSREDWGTQAFRDIAMEWHDVQNLDATALANAIKRQNLDVLFDLGGWSDPVGLKAISVKPAQYMFKWVGGQSATTGLTVFDGFISDRYHSPPGSERLHSEKITRMKQAYCHYSPPAYLPKPTAKKNSQIAVIGNPVKISNKFLNSMRTTKQKLQFIDRRYSVDKVKNRILTAIDREITFTAPASHQEYLHAIAQFPIVMDTFPYASGLCAIEALTVGAKIIMQPGELFSSRHSYAHTMHKISNVTSCSKLSRDLSNLIRSKTQ